LLTFTALSRLLHESTERDRFVTAFYGVLDWRNGVLIFTNAGHNPPLLLRADGTTEELTDGGVALGATFAASALRTVFTSNGVSPGCFARIVATRPVMWGAA